MSQVTERQPQQVQIALPSVAPKATYVILGFTVFIYLIQVLLSALGYTVYDRDYLLVFGARINQAIRAGELWRLITPAFLHFSLEHILFNMYALFSVGSFIERQFGHKRFLLLYFLAAFSGNVMSFLWMGDNSISAGASGAIFGLVAAEAVFFYQNRKLFGNQAQKALSNIAFIVVINLFLGISFGYDNWGHAGGFLGGAMFAWFAGPRWKIAGLPPLLHLEDERETREVFLGTSLVAILLGVLTLCGIFFK